MEKNAEKRKLPNKIIFVSIVVFICIWSIVIVIPELSLSPELTSMFDSRMCKLLLALLLAGACTITALIAFLKWIGERRETPGEKLQVTALINDPIYYVVRNKNLLFAVFLLFWGAYFLCLFFFFSR
uniref:Uncharacterized protein n=1 Tax=candidate division WOR-3 bacterium TaxID=2052148 RepID=A0A7C6AH28_UNCW3